VAGFVGRDRELSRLRVALGGGTRLLLVVGDAGVGKTRFAGEGMRRAAAGGWVPVWGRCLPLAEKLPLLPVAEALGELSELDGGGLLEAVLALAPPYVRVEIERRSQFMLGKPSCSHPKSHPAPVPTVPPSADSSPASGSSGDALPAAITPCPGTTPQLITHHPGSLAPCRRHTQHPGRFTLPRRALRDHQAASSPAQRARHTPAHATRLTNTDPAPRFPDVWERRRWVRVPFADAR